MLQREEAPTGDSSSRIHVVYLLSICLIELLLQVFEQPHTLVLQILRKLLVQKNQSESLSNVHRWQLCCVRYYRDELWMDVISGPARIRTAAGFNSRGDQHFPHCQTKCIFWSHQHCHVPQRFLHRRIGSFGCSHHSGLAHFWAAFGLCQLRHTYSLACFLYASSQNYILPVPLFSPWYLGTCCLKMS